MKRRRHAAGGLSVSLFPFLAVLICTMGVLIVMLVMAVQSSRHRAADRRQSRDAELAARREQLLAELDLQQFRRQELESLRPELRERLSVQRSRRSHIEEETRRLLDQAADLERQWREIDNELNGTGSLTETAPEAVEQIEAEIAELESQIVALRKETAARPALYSIVPTQTANGTARRPIYIECTPEGILIQPAGLLIGLNEFTLPVMAGNPLDAAILATREHWMRYQLAGDGGSPYPLLLVRPGGAPAYAIARRAMASWDDEFGYELVEADKQIDWGQPDAELGRVLAQAVAIARSRQEQMVALRQVKWINDAAPSRTGSSFPHGPGSAGNNGGGEGLGAQPVTANATGDTPAEDWGQMAPGLLAKNEFRAQESATGSESEGEGGSASVIEPGPDGEEKSPVVTAAPTGENFSSASGARQGGGTSAGMSIGSIRPLAESRGESWALPQRTPGATAYRRPIRVDCLADRLIVHNTDPARPVTTIEHRTTDDETIDALVNEIWKLIKDWGMAESGGYWKPVLRVAAPDHSTLRAAQLERKLDGSGIEIERLWR